MLLNEGGDFLAVEVYLDLLASATTSMSTHGGSHGSEYAFVYGILHMLNVHDTCLTSTCVSDDLCTTLAAQIREPSSKIPLSAANLRVNPVGYLNSLPKAEAVSHLTLIVGTLMLNLVVNAERLALFFHQVLAVFHALMTLSLQRFLQRNL